MKINSIPYSIKIRAGKKQEGKSTEEERRSRFARSDLQAFQTLRHDSKSFIKRFPDPSSQELPSSNSSAPNTPTVSCHPLPRCRALVWSLFIDLFSEFELISSESLNQHWREWQMFLDYRQTTQRRKKRKIIINPQSTKAHASRN